MATTRKGTPAEPVFSPDTGDLTFNTANQYLQQRQIAWLEEATAVLQEIKANTGKDVNTAPDGSTRVSQRTILGDYKHHIGAQSLLMDSATVGTGSISFVASESAMRMTTSADGDVVVHQSKIGHNYQSGNPQSMEGTSDNLHIQTNIIKRAGYFSTTTASPYLDNMDGVFFESNGVDNTFYFCVYKDYTEGSSGSITARIARADWDDPLNGQGPSGINYQFDKFTIILIDFLWLGGSDFRLFVKTGSSFTLAHTYIHASKANGVAMLSPIKPVRYEIRQAGEGSGTFDMICARVATEGGLNQLGLTPCVSTGIATIDANTAGTMYAVVGYRMQSGDISRFLETAAISLSMQESSGNNNRYEWKLLLNPTIAGAAPSFNNIINSPIQGAVADTVNSPSVNTVTDEGTPVSCGFGSDDITPEIKIIDSIKPGSTIGGALDEVWLVATPSSNNQRISASITIFVFL